MNKVVIVSFFCSNNLGDLALSNTIENMVSENYNIIKYDFLSLKKINPTTKDELFEKEINVRKIGDKKSKRKIKHLIKKIMIKIGGEVNTAVFNYKIKSLQSSRKWKEIENDIVDAHKVIIGGGNMIMDLNPVWVDILKKYINLAKKHNKHVDLVYVGVGPVIYKRSEKIYREFLKNVQYLSVRDFTSKTCMEKLLLSDKSIVQSVDPAFMIEIDVLEERQRKVTSLKTEYSIGVSVLGEMCFNSLENHRTYMKNLTNLIKNIIKNDSVKKKIILFSTEIADYNAIQKVYNMLSFDEREYCEIEVIKKINDIIYLYKELDFLIGGRMHGMIFSQICLLPFVGVEWQSKVRGFAIATGNDDKIFKVDEFEYNFQKIINIIINDINDERVIKSMKKKNDMLKEIALKGMKI